MFREAFKIPVSLEVLQIMAETAALRVVVKGNSTAIKADKRELTVKAPSHTQINANSLHLVHAISLNKSIKFD